MSGIPFYEKNVSQARSDFFFKSLRISANKICIYDYVLYTANSVVLVFVIVFMLSAGYHDQHPVIIWFWEAIEKFDNERQLRLLQVQRTQ